MTSTQTTYSLDTTNLTVIATDENGERFDLNAGGEPCADIFDLQSLVKQLWEVGGITGEVYQSLAAAAYQAVNAANA